MFLQIFINKLINLEELHVQGQICMADLQYLKKLKTFIFINLWKNNKN